MDSPLRATTVRDSDQDAVWRTVDSVLARNRVHSPTSAYSDMVNERVHDIGARVERLAPVADQMGFAEVRRGQLVVIDLLGSP